MGASKGHAVLIVDECHARLMCDALTRRGFAVFHATSPDEAWALFEAHRAQITLVVIDLMKPATGNLDLASDLERLRPGLPVLYVAGARRTIACCSIAAQSPGAVLAVPFTAEQFLGRVEGLLDLEAARQLPDEQLWERLLADSVRLSSETTMLYVYELGQSALAAGHVTMLRAAQIRHALRPTNFEAAPYSVMVRAVDAARARGLIAQVCASGLLGSAA
jgi:DNA-binding NtrC family response regulator